MYVKCLTSFTQMFLLTYEVGNNKIDFNVTQNKSQPYELKKW